MRPRKTNWTPRDTCLVCGCSLARQRATWTLAPDGSCLFFDCCQDCYQRNYAGARTPSEVYDSLAALALPRATFPTLAE